MSIQTIGRYDSFDLLEILCCFANAVLTYSIRNSQVSFKILVRRVTNEAFGEKTID